MITQKELTLIEAWDELNKTNNKIDLLETQIAMSYDISSSKLKEIMTQCSFSSNDKHLNILISKDERVPRWLELQKAKAEYEIIVYNEIQRLKLTEPAICIAFLKEYKLKDDNKKMTWEDISKEMGYSVPQCRRYYDEYKGRTPKENSWFKDDVKSI